MYTMYVDETGDRNLEPIDPRYPVPGLCGFVISEQSYENHFCPGLDKIKRDHFGGEHIVLTSSAIRHRKGVFSILTDSKTNEAFIADMNRVMTDTEYWLISSVIHKKAHKEQYVEPFDPYELSVDFLLERFVHFVRWHGGQLGHVVFESRSPKDDARVQREYSSVLTDGTPFISARTFRRFLGMTPTFRRKRDNINGLQGADLAAYPVARTVLHQDPHPSFHVLAPKLYGGLFDEPHKYGLKCFPAEIGFEIPILISKFRQKK